MLCLYQKHVQISYNHEAYMVHVHIINAPFKVALYDAIQMADFRSKRHFGPKSPDFTKNKFTMHR